MSLFPTRKPTGVWWRDHSLSIVVGAILLVQVVFAIWSGWAEWLSQQADHGGGKAESMWNREFWTWLAYEANMSTLADTYGVLLIVVLSKFLYEQGSAESN